MSDTSVLSSSQSVAPVLPDAASHSYLGPGNSTIDNCHVLSAGSVYKLLLYPIPDVVLFPGQTIPLRIQNRAFIHKFLTMRSAPQGDTSSLVGHIGIVNISQFRNLQYGSLAKIGTTMEVRSTYRQSFNDVELVVSGKGRYRFLVKEIKSESGVPIATVEILSDSLPQFVALSPKMNSFPKWVYDQYSPRRLARIAFSLFESTMLWEGKDNAIQRWGLIRPLDPGSSVWSMYNTQFAEYEAEKDPVGFSFFLCSNMPVESAVVQMMLEAECVVQRLRLAISLLRTGLHKKIACARCGQILGNKQDLFNVSGAEGLAAVYVNRYGSVHQTLTIRKLTSDTVVRYQGRPSLQDTWFPGYAWTIMSCSRCFAHLGWKYTWLGVDQAAEVSSDTDENSSLMSEDDGDEDDEEDYEDIISIDGLEEEVEGGDEHAGEESSAYETIDDGEDESGDASSDRSSERIPSTSGLPPVVEATNTSHDNSMDSSSSSSSDLPPLVPLPVATTASIQDVDNALSSASADQPLPLSSRSMSSSSEEDNNDPTSQIVLAEFWGLTRASIKEI